MPLGVIARLRARLGLVLLGLGGACYGAPAAPAPQAPTSPPLALDSIPIGTPLQLSVDGARARGSLSGVSFDSLSLRGEGVVRTFARAELDTVWYRAPHAHPGTTAGLAFGLLAGGALVLAGGGHAQPESGSYSRLLGFYVFLGALGLGVLADMASPGAWIPISLQ